MTAEAARNKARYYDTLLCPATSIARRCDYEGPYPARGHGGGPWCTWRVLQVCGEGGCQPFAKEPEINLIEWRGPRHEPCRSASPRVKSPRSDGFALRFLRATFRPAITKKNPLDHVCH